MTPAAARRRNPRGQGELLRGEILDAAEQLLLETQSVEAVSIRAVADRVGVTPPSIYRHFPDKTHLLFDVCNRLFDDLNTAVADVEVEGDPLATLFRQAEVYVRFGIEHPEHYRVAFMDRTGFTPEQYLNTMVADGAAFTRLVQTVEQIVDAHPVAPELLVDGTMGLALNLWAAVHGLTSLLIAKPAAPWPPLDRAIRAQVHLLIGGLFGGALAPDELPKP